MTAYLLYERYCNYYEEGWSTLVFIFLDKDKAENKLNELIESHSQYTYNLIEMDIS
jgi:hypothetical protein